MEKTEHRFIAFGLLLTLLLALARIVFLPVATTDGGDSVYRVWGTIRWLEDPYLITYGVWGPLHYYLLALVLWIWPDPVHASVALHVLIGVATPLVIYVFTRTAVGGLRASLLVAVTYAIYPIAIRNSLQVRSEVPFVLLVMVGLVFVELARGDKGSWKHALAAGLSLTLAAMLRYEAWMLIGFLTLLLWRKPRLLGLFLACALIHPLFWMVGNGIQYGDPLYSISWATRWEQDSMGRAMIPVTARIVQSFDYLISIFRGMTFPVGIVAVVGAAIALFKCERCRAWLLPISGLAVLLMWSISRGTLVPKINYTVTIGTMLFPFTAVVWRRLGIERWPVTRMLMLGVTFIGLMVFSMRGGWMNAVGLARLTSTYPIPTVRNQDAALTLPGIISHHMPSEPALISDFYGWGASPYVAFLTRFERACIWLTPGAPNLSIPIDSIGRHPLPTSRKSPPDPVPLSDFVVRNPEGILIALEGSRLSDALEIRSGKTARVGIHFLLLERVHRVPWPPGNPIPHLEVFRYRISDDGDAEERVTQRPQASAAGP